MTLAGNKRAARRRMGAAGADPLGAIDKVWKAAAGPTQPLPAVGNATGPPIQLAGTLPRRKRGAGGYSKGTGRPD